MALFCTPFIAKANMRNSVTTYCTWLFLCVLLSPIQISTADKKPVKLEQKHLKKIGIFPTEYRAEIQRQGGELGLDAVRVKMQRPGKVPLFYQSEHVFFKVPMNETALSLASFIGFLSSDNKIDYRSEFEVVREIFFNSMPDLVNFNYNQICDMVMEKDEGRPQPCILFTTRRKKKKS